MPYSILAINPGHDGSAALVVDGELVFYVEEERLSRMKRDGNPFRAMLQIMNLISVDELIIGGTTNNLSTLPWTGENAYAALARKFNPNVKITLMGHLHHLGHAASAFYNSGFETAAAVIVDGAGSFVQEKITENGPVTGGFETESIYQCAYPSEFNAVYKRYADGNSIYFDNGIQEFDTSVTITKAYEAVSDYLGFGFIEAGKTMGLSSYGQSDPNIPSFFINGKGNRNLLIPAYPAGAVIDENRFPYLKRFNDPNAWHREPGMVRDVDKNLAWHVQKETEQQVIELIKKAVDLTGETNIVISGGYGLNCVCNYRLLAEFPDYKFYAEPTSNDGGTAIGLARYAWHVRNQDSTVRPLTSAYLGPVPDYNQLQIIEQNFNNNIAVEDATVDDIVDMIDSGSIVAIFQGRSEAGPRALGNRSILFDPRRADGQDIVNQVKNREWFRPFAASVLDEEASSWFDMRTLTSSPFMLYAVDVLNDKKDLIPAVTHVDGTCRIQTVTTEQNPRYYELISAWNRKTGVPMLLNTSFNLAGQPLVESVIDAVLTILNSRIDCLYLPEIGKKITKTQ